MNGGVKSWAMGHGSRHAVELIGSGWSGVVMAHSPEPYFFIELC